MSELFFDYQFRFVDGSERHFNVRIDADSCVNLDQKNDEAPEWTLLEVNKCEHCPYSVSDFKHCPVALSIARVADEFKADLSYKEVQVFVKTDNRFYGKKTDLQTGLQSLFGLMMATSPCSHMDLFKPMARFHLPFSTYDETVVRVLGKYLITQYLRAQKGEAPDMKLDGLLAQYESVSKVNQGMIKRVRSATKGMGDADKNAIIILDGFASLLPMDMQGGFETLTNIFKQVS